MGSGLEPLSGENNRIFLSLLGILSGGGFLNNLIFLVVILRRRLKSRYTMFILTKQTVADCLLSLVTLLTVVLPKEVQTGVVLIDHVLCYVWTGQFVLWLLVDISILSLLFTAVDRYCAILRPAQYGSHVLRKILLSTALIYSWSILMNSEVFLEIDFANKTCNTEVEHHNRVIVMYLKVMTSLWVLGGYFVPTVAMVIMYTFVHRCMSRLKSSDDIGQSRRSFTKATTLNVGIFIFTNGFDSIYFILSVFGVVEYVYSSPLQLFGTFLTSVNSAANPTVYLATMRSFRKMYSRLFLDVFCTGKRNKVADSNPVKTDEATF